MTDAPGGFEKELQRDFLEEATFLLDQCEESYLKLEVPELRREELAKIFRVMHSIKGAGAAVGFHDLSKFAHCVEDCLSVLRSNPDVIDSAAVSLLLKTSDMVRTKINLLKSESTAPWDPSALAAEVRQLTDVLQQRLTGAPASPSGPAPGTLTTTASTAAPIAATAQPTPESTPKPGPVQAEHHEPHPTPVQASAQTAAAGGKDKQTIKVDTERVDSILNLVGELVVIKSQLLQSQEASANSNAASLLSMLDKAIRDLHDRTLSMRTTALKTLFLKLNRIARDLSFKLNKPIDCVMKGEDTEIDRTMVEMLSDPLMHMVRNAIDHGIENIEKRREAGKPEKGTVEIRASQDGGRIQIEIVDDGGGIPREKVLKKAIEKGLIPADTDTAAMPDKDVFDLLFAPGLSTAEKVTDVSGRGVGMDVVKSSIVKLHGDVHIESETGKGSKFKISLPLTTAITDGMILESDSGGIHILPLSSVVELLFFDPQSLTQVRAGHRVLKVRERFLPFFSLEELLGIEKQRLTNNNANTGESLRHSTVVAIEHSGTRVALLVRAVLGQGQFVIKPLGTHFENVKGIGGVTILGDGTVAPVLDVDSLIKRAKVAGATAQLSLETELAPGSQQKPSKNEATA